MDQNLIYAKTPIGDEAVRQSTRVVQRNLRMVLVQVDGKMTVGELAEKVGNAKLVEAALVELEKGGFIAPALEAASVWEESARLAQQRVAASSPASQFSTFGPKSLQQSDAKLTSRGLPSVFSTFGKPILPVDEEAEAEAKSGLRERLAATLEKHGGGEGSPRDSADRPPIQLRPAMLGWLLLFAFIFAAGVVLLFPYGRYKPEFEAALGRAFGGTARIESVAIGFQPRPGLYLRNIRIGEGGDSRIDDIRLPSPLALFGSGRKTLNGMDMSGITLGADRLAVLSSGPGGSPEGSGFILGQVTLRDVTVVTPEIALSGLSGEAFFKPAGGLDKLTLQTADRSLRIEALPTAMGLGLTIAGLAWKPSGEGKLVFDAMQAKALLQKGKLIVQDVDATVLGGAVRGSWLLDWTNGLVMAGDASLARLNSRLLAETLGVPLRIDGELSGSMRFRGTGGDWHGLWAGAEALVDAEISRGVLHGVDLGEAARRGVSRTGGTKFESLKGSLRVSAKQFEGRDLQLSAGLLSASGNLGANRAGTVVGAFSVTLAGSASPVRANIRVSGQQSAMVAESVR